MERETLITAMKDSISEVLEKMFFLPLDFSEDENERTLWESKKDDVLVSKMDFSGPISGSYILFTPNGLAISLAASFMGTDDETLSDEQVHETLKEILNMIVGNTFCIFDDQTIVNLGLPEMTTFDNMDATTSSGEEIFIAINTLDESLALKIVL